jgi:hypothetical protein
MARTFLSLLILGSLVDGVLAGTPTAIAFSEPQTGISLPGNLGPLKYLGVRHYEDRELGVCIRYEGGGLIKADIFIYDLGEKNLGTGLQSPALTRHFDQVKRDLSAMEKIGRYKSLDQVSEQKIAIQTPRGRIPALSAIFTYSQTAGPGTAFTGQRVSHLILTAYRQSFLKIRFTYPQNQQERGAMAFKQFIDDLGRHLDE